MEMMRPIHNVLVAGGTGNIGPSIIQALVAANYTVSVLTRRVFISESLFGRTVRVIQTDYSLESLAAALSGQDAVVSTLGLGAEKSQTNLLIAAAKSWSSNTRGVQRFIPSEFGIPNLDLRENPELARLLQPRIQFRHKMKDIVTKNPQLTYTGVFTRLWFDWCIKVGLLGFHLDTKSATIIDSGNETFKACDLATAGEAVAAILRKPTETANQYITISSHETTQNKILEELERYTGSDWTVMHRSGRELYAQAWESIQSGHNGWPAMSQAYFFMDRDVEKVPMDNQGSLDGNKLLGIGFCDLHTTITKLYT